MIMRILATGVLAIAAMFSQGCIAAGTYLAVKAVYGVAEKGNTIGMNYHEPPPAVWDATQAQLAAMELTPEGKPELKKDKGELQVGKTKIRIAPLKKAPGTRVDVVTTLADSAKVREARDLLNGVAARLHEYREAVQDFPADLKTTYDAALAEAKAMGYEPGPGTKLEADSGQIRVGDVVATLEPLAADRTRVHVGVGTASVEHDLERANEFFEGISERLH
jgi:hypothetical protein